ncbi:hypothetical protein MKK88_09985 [Methylobacterium sp. E-005]|uniref:hypothetical protein n=1 Tax=Methylobacterium sp. E-005 TaxID=2836549 RepID=UPI001FB9EF5A|nr:hypothetical protein [Methylobacterium sp. E-005]MCJ2086320.1 hypothetical protein [Methylobacterium sp. E-005]
MAQDGWQSETATPLTSALKPPTALDGPQDQPESASPYGGIASALKSIAGGQQKQGQKVAGGVGMAVPKMDGRAMTLQQPRQQFDASRFLLDAAEREAGLDLRIAGLASMVGHVLEMASAGVGVEPAVRIRSRPESVN